MKTSGRPGVSAIQEAQALVRRCAEPRPASDHIKQAIRRASRRLDMPFSRIKNIWYGEAKRIDADEMDRLRHAAKEAELSQAIAAITGLRNKVLATADSEVIAGLNSALRAVGCNAEGNRPSMAKAARFIGALNEDNSPELPLLSFHR